MQEAPPRLPAQEEAHHKKGARVLATLHDNSVGASLPAQKAPTRLRLRFGRPIPEEEDEREGQARRGQGPGRQQDREGALRVGYFVFRTREAAVSLADHAGSAFSNRQRSLQVFEEEGLGQRRRR